jgi:hypothetical protein
MLQANPPIALFSREVRNHLTVLQSLARQCSYYHCLRQKRCTFCTYRERFRYSTVTDLAKLRGLSMSCPSERAAWYASS